ncbi:MAG: bifunctional UDP-N-acetylglucosamine diphosphorylase/glucosamine-1-phosphate N-acetyltransferase GlmU [Bacillota bacterium]|nr:bifunctional UDP-N-acetylglucosamine diphosphorylase/glucosamine-1-phosphate N-acetyltransferase GlmU [Bacillota bacterium]
MEQLTAVILAAGEGKRMKSKNAKCSHKICGKPMVEWVYRAVQGAGSQKSAIIVGHKAEQIKEILGDKAEYACQDKQLGTGHAVMQAGDFLKDKDGTVIVLCGDAPLITEETLKKTLDYHKENNNSATVITAIEDDPTGYGRIIRNSQSFVSGIIEHRDASPEQRSIKEINSGMYCFNTKLLLEALKELSNDNDQGEYYLTDTIGILLGKGYKVGAFTVSNPDEVLGINDRIQLAQASDIMKRRILDGFMKSGATIIDPASTYIDADSEIGIDTVIYPGTIIEGKSIIGEDCIIGPNSRLVNSIIENGAEVNNSVVLESRVGQETHVGPFAYIRPGSVIGSKVKIGDFVEVKKSVIGDGTKVSHLTYVGDSEVGKGVNLGCGVVTVNYDGSKKYKTTIGDGAFIGCNVNLVSPVNVGDNAYIAAGSTITEDVPGNALAVARERQVNKEDWVVRKGIKKK